MALDFSDVSTVTIPEGKVAKIVIDGATVWEKEKVEFKGLTMTNNSSSDAEVTFTPASSLTIDLHYSNDDGDTWTTWPSSGTVTVGSAETICLKGDNPNGFATSDSDYSIFAITGGTFTCGGDIMSLVYGEDTDLYSTSIPSNYCFCKLFQSAKIVSAPKCSATTMAPYCFYHTYDSCTSLRSVSDFPNVTLAGRCYEGMFYGCTSLTTAPALPTTTLAISCYSYMFAGCTSLTAAPTLPATTLTSYCYAFMFTSCTSLTTAPALPATATEGYCYEAMFASCTSLTTAPTLPATTLKVFCYLMMFYDCTSLRVSEGSGTKKFFTCPSYTSLVSPVMDMFKGTGGSYTSDPVGGNTYYYN